MADLADLLSGGEPREPQPEANPFLEDEQLLTADDVAEALAGACVGIALAGVAAATGDPVAAWNMKDHIHHDRAIQAARQAVVAIRVKIAAEQAEQQR